MRRISLPLMALTLLIAACAGESESATVRLLTHDFFAVPDELLAEFTADTGIEVEIIRGGDAGIVVNQAILAAGNPVADVLFGVDTTLLSRAIDADLFEPYRSGAGARFIDQYDTAEGLVTPIDFGDVCLNYDTALLPNPPTSLEDLTAAQYRGMLVVPDPTISSPGLAFLLATIDRFGEDGPYTWRDYWADLRANDVQIVADWGAAYYGSFSATGTGSRPIVVSYASSPPAEVLFSDPPIDEATTAVIEDGCFRQVEYAGVLRGTPNREPARRLIDFMLGVEFQESVPTSMFVFPVNPAATLPDVFLDNTSVPSDPASLAPQVIERNRERWLTEWIDTVLR
ncbi:MAG: thiamine ABC transporter substrate-binding protein [Acidimicrobiia bacterium]